MNNLYKDLDSIQEATFLSACNPSYFKPCSEKDAGDVKDRVFISGDSWAVSPAMYTYSYALANKKATANNIRVVSIGNIKERADKIPDDIGIFEWISRISSLQGPSKLYSQEFMLDMSIRENAPTSDSNNHLYKFNYLMSRDTYSELDTANSRKIEVNSYAEDMINENKEEIDILLENLVKERITT